MAEEKSEKLDVKTVATGCVASGGVGCLQAVVLMIIIGVTGANIQGMTPETVPFGFQIIGLVLSILANVTVGYITAYRAPHAKMRHAFLVGALLMLLGATAVVSNPEKIMLTELNVLGFALTVPLMLLGAKLAIDGQEKEE